MSVPTLIQVTNVSPSANLQHMRELFSYFGDIEELNLFPEDEFAALSVPSKVCFVRFKESSSMSSCLHLSNTVLIDRALIIARSRYTTIPDGTTAMSLAAPAVALANSSMKAMGHTAPLLPTPPSIASALNPLGPAASIGLGITTPAQPSSLASLINPVIPQPTPVPSVSAASLISLMGTVVPQPPPLTGNVDPTKIEEIRRTIYVGNLASNMTAEQVLTFFQPCGEIKYVRMAGDETQPTRFAFVEFATPESVPIALQYNGAMFGERPIKVNHSKNAIVKPQGPTPQEAKRDVDEAMKRVKEAMMDIEAKVVPGVTVKKNGSTPGAHDRIPHTRSRSRDRKRRSRSRSPPYRGSRSWKRSRSRSPPRRRSRSRSPPRRRSRSRSPPRRRSRSRSPPRRRSRSRSPPRRRSRSPRRRKSRSKSPVRRRSRSKSPVRRRSRSRSPKRRKSRSKSPRHSRGRHRRSRSRSNSPRRRKSRSPKRRRRDDSVERRGRNKSPPTRRSPSLTPEPSPPPRKSSKSKKHRRRSPSQSPSSPARGQSPSERSSSRRKKHSKKHRRHHRKSHSPSPIPSPAPLSDKESGRDSRKNQLGSGDSPLVNRRGSGSEKGEGSPEIRKAEVDVDTDSSYD